jgi:predicted nucleic acid-binding protein
VLGRSEPLLRGWGAARTAELHNYLRKALVLQVTDDVQRRYAELTALLMNSGHALGEKHHVADRWVAATALANRVPLATMDGIFNDVPGLNLLTP